ncbi:hypothetical protein C731_1095 [Mycolicibacterium hassiacum DSM 44199]|jgi:hypothetical protein|uniref:Uncharacterized protein n=1 Tax=Mycolicibacterium hassiacum (strain DSM 44199 / CIP 105218 / JCM 12690 / 3849) TaxID=1122247 RepID=K5BC51_MYCHD|nr:DUF732 domain-containing protein [Mycolicibacterium hassiacum]EKF24920.1 hypothetical protein C731_1095 [Mycolicibacterium hassiacum DSM 44199]MBX5485640.1 DUF732 domain-containing protein [Mycolicibacterium hassiacum]MDA4088227.1 hypothetical protein [Mycolicibacterium hassiacum DSM 44199]PZN20003.1 MAG: DUF732 domain-containing protein [Mycolicibacterium hassiacum]VCT88572.1 hypothetical protein MHAS_00256 [Mycolicibacterium hassiacum DSM 44199]
MTFLHRMFTGLVAAAAIAGPVVWGGATAHAQNQDEKFAELVETLGIPVAPGTDLPAVGHRVCDMLGAGLSGTVNPVPVVRGVVNTLENSGIERAQAAGLMRAAVQVYCPQYTRFLGR